MTLGEQIRQARENKNLSQEELASRLGVSHQAISKWENDVSVPHGINREMLSKLLELEVSAGEEPTARKQSRIMWLGTFLAILMPLFPNLAMMTEKAQNKGIHKRILRVRIPIIRIRPRRQKRFTL